MELTLFFKIIRRSWLLVVGLPLLVLVFALVTFKLPPQRYRTTAKIAVSQAMIAPSDSSFPDFNSYHSWAASEYVADDLPQIVTSATFARDLQAWIKQEQGMDIARPAIQAGLNADRIHRVLNLHIAAPTPEAAQAIAQGTVALLKQKGLSYWARQQQGGLDAVLLEALPAAPENRWREPLWTLLLRLVLGFAAGLFLAFLRFYFDPTVREREDLEALGLEVVGLIPPETKPQASGVNPRTLKAGTQSSQPEARN